MGFRSLLEPARLRAARLPRLRVALLSLRAALG
jgi:hypothetical protein